MDSTVHGVLQARTLEWVAVPFRESSQLKDQTQVSCTVADSLLAEPEGTYSLLPHPQLSLRFYLAPVYREAELSASVPRA